MNETKEQAIPNPSESPRLPVVWEIAVVEQENTKTMTVVFPARQVFEDQRKNGTK